MNDDVFKGKWMQFKGAIKEKWGQLTDDDFDTAGGQRDQRHESYVRKHEARHQHRAVEAFEA